MEGRDLDLRIAPVSVQSQIVAKLREAIFAGTFIPGEKLGESALCRDLGVSRASIREALRSLAAEKLVTIVPNRGPSVTKITWEEADAIYKVRALLEGEAAALLATRIQEPDLREMSAALTAFEAAAWKDDGVDRMASATRFYEIILTRRGNPIIGEMLQSLHARINFLRAGTMSIPGRSLAACGKCGPCSMPWRRATPSRPARPRWTTCTRPGPRSRPCMRSHRDRIVTRIASLPRRSASGSTHPGLGRTRVATANPTQRQQKITRRHGGRASNVSAMERTSAKIE